MFSRGIERDQWHKSGGKIFFSYFVVGNSVSVKSFEILKKW